MGTLKGFKVTDSDRKLRVGIAAKNLDELKTKTLDKFKLNLQPSQLLFQMPDGTIVESNEYFQTIEAQTLLIWVKKGQRAETDAEILYKTIREVNEEYLSAGEKVQEFFTEKMKNKVFKLAEVLKGIDNSRGAMSKRTEHPEWFVGLDTTAKTKEDYMFKRAQDRIRTYYYKTKDELLKNNEVPPETVQKFLIELQTMLKSVSYFGCYFDRNYSVGDLKLRSLCDESGNFFCQGRWDKKSCLYLPMHRINPYVSREERIIFQTWNLDHGIERSRAILPVLCEALEELDRVANGNYKRQINIRKVFNDLFTTNNLKFVHIVCHDKGAHRKKTAGPYLL